MDGGKKENTAILRAVSSFEKYADDACPDAVSGGQKVIVLAAKNSYECAQVLIFAQQDITCDATVSDLIGPENSVYSACNVTIYAEKYIYVDRNWQANGLPTGNYPDALLPLEAAKAHAQTDIDAGKNKGFWLEFFVPADQKPGIYRGTVTVNAGDILTLPVELEVLNLHIPEQTGVRSLFHTNFEHMSHYEKGDMLQMYDKYIRYLLDHRICQTEFIRTGGAEEFAQKAAELYRDGFRTFSLPSGENTVDGHPTFSDELIEMYLYALAKKSLECGEDFVSCVAFYDWRIDEPYYCGYAPGRVQSAVDRFSVCAQRVSEKCKAEAAFDTAFGRQVVTSVKNACHLITDYYAKTYFEPKEKKDKEGNPYNYDRSKVTLCPKFDGYDKPEWAALYEKCQQRWWYGCNTPNAPFVSYHIDDAAYSPRLVGGMMARHGIVGNLYWANNIYTEINTTGSPLFLEDPYGTAHRGCGANGDGALLYPGSLYGIDGPVGCIRLKNIREGNQDWELLRQTQRRYEQSGASFWEVYDRQLSSLAHGTKIDSIYGDYSIVHQSVMRLCEAAMSDLGLTIEPVLAETGVSYTLRTCTECTIYVDGEVIPKEQGYYRFFQEYKPGQWCRLQVLTADSQRTIPLYCGQGMQIILHETLFEANAVTTLQGTVTLNPDDIRREITVTLVAPGTVHIDLGTWVTAGQTLGFEVNTVEPCFVTVWADGYEQEKHKIKTIPRWNRIQIPTDTREFSTNGINIRFETAIKAGFGAVYIQR